MRKNLLSAPAICKGEYDGQRAWGLLAVINLYECDPERIKSAKKIREFIIKLCRIIKMKRHGKTIIDRFAEGSLEGYSMMQFIKTSSITAHFDEEKSRAFIDIFSCQFFNADRAAKFSKKFFNAKNYRTQILIRK